MTPSRHHSNRSARRWRSYFIIRAKPRSNEIPRQTPVGAEVMNSLTEPAGSRVTNCVVSLRRLPILVSDCNGRDARTMTTTTPAKPLLTASDADRVALRASATSLSDAAAPPRPRLRHGVEGRHRDQLCLAAPVTVPAACATRMRSGQAKRAWRAAPRMAWLSPATAGAAHCVAPGARPTRVYGKRT